MIINCQVKETIFFMMNLRPENPEINNQKY